MRDEDVTNVDFRCQHERLLFVNAATTFILPLFFSIFDFNFAMGFLVALGLLAPVNVFHYRFAWVDSEFYVRRLYALCLVPAIILLITTIYGMINPVVVSFSQNGSTFFKMIESSSPLVNVGEHAKYPISSQLIFLSIVALSCSIYFLTDSIYVMRRIVLYCGFATVLYACFIFAYFLIKYFELAFVGSSGTALFVFKEPSAWASLATLWVAGLLLVFSHYRQNFSLGRFIISMRFLLLITVSILYASILCTKLPAYIIISSITIAFSFFLLAFNVIPTLENQYAHWDNNSLRKMPKRNKFWASMPALFYFGISVAALSLAVYVFSNSFYNANELILIDSQNQSSITLEQKSTILKDIIPVINERPFFGWGSGSFKTIYSFVQSLELGSTPIDYPNSDLLKVLVEEGLFGLLLILVVPIFFFIIWLIKLRHSFFFFNFPLLLTCFLVLTLSIFSNPFQSPLTTLSFYILFFIAIKWGTAKTR